MRAGIPYLFRGVAASEGMCGLVVHNGPVLVPSPIISPIRKPRNLRRSSSALNLFKRVEQKVEKTTREVGTAPPLATRQEMASTGVLKTEVQISEEFAWMKERSMGLHDPSSAFTSAKLVENIGKNRYKDVFAVEHSRVRLHGLLGNDYINANHVKCDGRHASGKDAGEEAYICTQAPLPTTMEDFWRMVWEQRTGVIVMLTRLFEGGKRKADCYWPTEGEEIWFGTFLVIGLRCKVSEGVTVRTFRIVPFVDGKGVGSRDVFHLQYGGWNDMGVPSASGVLHLVKLANLCKAMVAKRTRPGQTVGPTIVHCSAGIGRAGTFVAIDEALRCVRAQLHGNAWDAVSKLNVPKIVMDLRLQRMSMVQTQDQYRFIHEVLRHWATTLQPLPLAPVVAAC